MGWIRLEELLPHHRKVVALGAHAPAILGWYTAGVAFANRHLTDGVILPGDLPLLIPALRPSRTIVTRLVAARLWDERPEGGWVIHDFLEYNISATVRRAKIRADSERKKHGFRTDSRRNPNGFHADSTRIPEVEVEVEVEVEEKQKRERREEKKTGKTSLSRWRETACRLLEFLNDRTGAKFEPVPPNLALLAARLEDGATEAQIRGVIVHKIREWRGSEMEKYLRPKTLFNATNYAQYRGEIAREAADGALP